MQKFFTTLLVALCFCTAAFSQKRAGDVEVGVNIGLNLSTVTADQYTNSDYHTGFNAGVSLDYFFSSAWSIKGKVVYDQKGWNNGFIDYGNNQSYTTDYKLDYITIPVMANWHFGRTRNWFLDFGPYLGILASAKETAGDADVKDFFNTTDAGLALGIGVKFPVGNGTKLFIELHGQGGISDIVKDNQGSSLRTNTSSLNVGFAF